MDLSAARTDPFFSLAGALLKQDQETLAVNLRKLQEMAVASTVEQAAGLAKKFHQAVLEKEIRKITASRT